MHTLKLGSIISSSSLDDSTIKLSSILNPTIQVPVTWDFDKGRKPFSNNQWGNDQYLNCEVASRANYLLRLERAQNKLTPDINSSDVISLYKTITGCELPEDANDIGTTTLKNLTNWRRGWKITKKWNHGEEPSPKVFKIDAFASLDPKDSKLLRSSINLFAGTLLLCNMPLSAKSQTGQRTWFFEDLKDDSTLSGSWGGHLVYIKRYDLENIYAISWGKEIKITNEWINKYAIEAYSVINDFNNWINWPHIVDIKKLLKLMKSLGIAV